jgi:peptide/nickel transport system ATP-binding protein
MGSTEKVFGDPRHPYTKMLLDCVPRLHEKWRTETIDGELRQADAAGAWPLVDVEDDHAVALAPPR